MFSSSFSSFLSFIFSKGWQFFQIQWPGTSISIGNIFIGVLVACFVMKLLFGFLGVLVVDTPIESVRVTKEIADKNRNKYTNKNNRYIEKQKNKQAKEAIKARKEKKK